jgi:hypothetical protein
MWILLVIGVIECYRTGVGKPFWVLPQNIFVYNDITPRPESEEKRTNCF